MISVIEASSQLERHKGLVFNVIKKLGIHARKQRDPQRNNQEIAYISDDDYMRLKEYFSERSKSRDTSDSSASFSPEIGVFYLIQLEPKFDPLRYKVGFAASIKDRLRALRCSAPYSKVLKTWPCKRLWEKTAIDSITSGCERIHTEVFRCTSMPLVMEKCERFFANMPLIEIDLSDQMPTIE